MLATFLQVVMVIGLIEIICGTGILLLKTFTNLNDHFETIDFGEEAFIIMVAGLVLFVGSVLILI